MNDNLPVYTIDPATGKETEIPVNQLPESAPERLKELVGYASKAAQVVRAETAGSLALGLILLRVQSERLHTEVKVGDGAGGQRAATSGEFLEKFAHDEKVSPSKISRAKKAANIYVVLAAAGVAPPLHLAHLFPLKDAETAHIVQIFQSARTKHGDHLTEDDVEREVADFYDRPYEKKASSFNNLKGKVLVIANDALQAIAANDLPGATAKLHELVALAGTESRKKSTEQTGKGKGNTRKKNSGVKGVPATPKVSSKKENEGKAEPAKDQPAPPNLNSPPSLDLSSKADEVPKKYTVGDTQVWLNGNTVVAANKPFSKKNPPPAYSILKDEFEFTWKDETKTWEKIAASLEDAERMRDRLLERLKASVLNQPKSEKSGP